MGYRRKAQAAASLDITGWLIAVFVVTKHPDWSLVFVSLILRAAVDLLPLRYRWTTVLASIQRGWGVVVLGSAALTGHPARLAPTVFIFAALVAGVVALRTDSRAIDSTVV